MIRCDSAALLAQTVRESYEGYTPREVKETRAAREAKAMMSHPSEDALKEAVSGTAIANLPAHINTKSIAHGQRMFGPSLADVRGKTV